MTQTKRMIASTVGLVTLLPALGCVPQDHGWASLYRPAQENKITVVMPAGAPSISQQFLFTTTGAKHLGIDVIGKVGDPVIAVAGGVVTGSFSEPAYGNRVEITHGSDVSGKRTRTVYKHLHRRLVSKGDVVSRGQEIGTLGTTGMLGGGIPHLHFELYRQAGGAGLVSTDPHRFWVNGVGRVTCFDPSKTYETGRFAMTYPAPCRSKWQGSADAGVASAAPARGLEALLDATENSANQSASE